VVLTFCFAGSPPALESCAVADCCMLSAGVKIHGGLNSGSFSDALQPQCPVPSLKGSLAVIREWLLVLDAASILPMVE